MRDGKNPTDESMSIMFRGEMCLKKHCWWKESWTTWNVYIKPCTVNNGINYQPQLVSWISEPSTVSWFRGPWWSFLPRHTRKEYPRHRPVAFWILRLYESIRVFFHSLMWWKFDDFLTEKWLKWNDYIKWSKSERCRIAPKKSPKWSHDRWHTMIVDMGTTVQEKNRSTSHGPLCSE